MEDIEEIPDLSDLIYDSIAESGSWAFQYSRKTLPAEVLVEAIQLSIDSEGIREADAKFIGSAVQRSGIESLRLVGLEVSTLFLSSMMEASASMELELDRPAIAASTDILNQSSGSVAGNLQSFSVDRASKLESAALSQFGQLFPALEALRVSASNLDTSSAVACVDGFTSVCTGGKHSGMVHALCFLDLSGNPGVEDLFTRLESRTATPSFDSSPGSAPQSGTKAPISSEALLPYLQHLSLSNCSLALASPAEVRAMARTAPRLTDLDASRTGMDNAGVEAVIVCLPQLHRLAIGGSGVTSAGILAIGSMQPGQGDAEDGVASGGGIGSEQSAQTKTLVQIGRNSGCEFASAVGHVPAPRVGARLAAKVELDVEKMAGGGAGAGAGGGGGRDAGGGEEEEEEEEEEDDQSEWAQQMKSGLSALDCSDLGLDDRAVAALKSFRQLEWLRLDGNRDISQTALEDLVSCIGSSIAFLSAAATGMTDCNAIVASSSRGIGTGTRAAGSDAGGEGEEEESQESGLVVADPAEARFWQAM